MAREAIAPQPWRKQGIGVDFGLTSDQTMLKALVERFVAEQYADNGRAAARATLWGYCPRNWALLAELGLLALPFAEDDGGIGGGPVEIITAAEALGRGLVAEPWLNEIIVAGGLLHAAGTAAQIATWLPRLIAGDAHLALAYAEHGARYTLLPRVTAAAGNRLTGQKTCVQAGADAYLVTANTLAGPALFLVPANAPGLAHRTYRLVDGAVACELTLHDVPAETMAGGIAALEAVAQTARLAACAELVGLMSLLMDMTLDYVRQRRQFGAPIGSFQAIQHRLADQYAALELSRSLLYRAVLNPDAAALPAAKCFIARAAITLGEECIQFHGGMGVSDELMIGHAHKRILVLATLFGDADHEMRRYDRARAGRPEGSALCNQAGAGTPQAPIGR